MFRVVYFLILYQLTGPGVAYAGCLTVGQDMLGDIQAKLREPESVLNTLKTSELPRSTLLDEYYTFDVEYKERGGVRLQANPIPRKTRTRVLRLFRRYERREISDSLLRAELGHRGLDDRLLFLSMLGEPPAATPEQRMHVALVLGFVAPQALANLDGDISFVDPLTHTLLIQDGTAIFRFPRGEMDIARAVRQVQLALRSWHGRLFYHPQVVEAASTHPRTSAQRVHYVMLVDDVHYGKFLNVSSGPRSACKVSEVYKVSGVELTSLESVSTGDCAPLAREENALGADPISWSAVMKPQSLGVQASAPWTLDSVPGGGVQLSGQIFADTSFQLKSVLASETSPTVDHSVMLKTDLNENSSYGVETDLATTLAPQQDFFSLMKSMAYFSFNAPDQSLGLSPNLLINFEGAVTANSMINETSGVIGQVRAQYSGNRFNVYLLSTTGSRVSVPGVNIPVNSMRFGVAGGVSTKLWGGDINLGCDANNGDTTSDIDSFEGSQPGLISNVACKTSWIKKF
jgi:hypothetical protein